MRANEAAEVTEGKGSAGVSGLIRSCTHSGSGELKRGVSPRVTCKQYDSAFHFHRVSPSAVIPLPPPSPPKKKKRNEVLSVSGVRDTSHVYRIKTPLTHAIQDVGDAAEGGRRQQKSDVITDRVSLHLQHSAGGKKRRCGGRCPGRRGCFAEAFAAHPRIPVSP